MGISTDAAVRIAEIENDGYTIIEGVMSTDLMQRIRDELAPFCQRSGAEHAGRDRQRGQYSGICEASQG